MTATTAPYAGPGLEDHLAVLTGSGRGRGWIELRYRTAHGMRSLYYPARARGRRSLGEVVANVSQRADVYLGAALRSRKAGDKTAVGQAWALWAEIDRPEARQAAEALSPSLLVASGSPGHVHAYWALQAPIGVEALEDANRRLAHAIGADPVSTDAGRILRPPGSLNHKHQPPRPVTQLAARRRGAHRLADILDRLPPTPEFPASHQAPAERSARNGDRLLEISPRDYVPALTGQTLTREGKACCPFHSDGTPSLHAYQAPERGWYCYGCRQGGSLYDLASQLWGLDTRGPEFRELTQRLRSQLL